MMWRTLVAVTLLTVVTVVTAAARDEVTEVFLKSRPGTVPRIPASLFLQPPSEDSSQGGVQHCQHIVTRGVHFLAKV